MAIGLTAKQKADLAAMLPNIEDSVSSLKRLITDTKDRSRALQKLADAEEAQKRHATDVGIPFNADAFARRRQELEALPKTLTVEDGQLSAFTALQRAIGIVLDGPFERTGRGGTAKATKKAAKGPKAVGKGSAKKSASKSPARPAAKQGKTKPASRPVAKRAPSAPAKAAAPMARVPFQKPLPLALGS